MEEESENLHTERVLESHLEGTVKVLTLLRILAHALKDLNRCKLMHTNNNANMNLGTVALKQLKVSKSCLLSSMPQGGYCVKWGGHTSRWQIIQPYESRK